MKATLKIALVLALFCSTALAESMLEVSVIDVKTEKNKLTVTYLKTEKSMLTGCLTVLTGCDQKLIIAGVTQEKIKYTNFCARKALVEINDT